MADTIDHIDHQGTVVEVDVRKGTVKVEIENHGDCGSCPAARLCGSFNNNSNIITVETKIAGAFRKGDKVTVSGTETLHRKAISLATGLPSVIMIAIMVGIYLLTSNQLAAVLCGIGSLVIFYLVLYLCRNKIAHEFRFTITKPDELTSK